MYTGIIIKLALLVLWATTAVNAQSDTTCQQCFKFSLVAPPDVYDFPPYRFYQGQNPSSCATSMRWYALNAFDIPYQWMLSDGQVTTPMSLYFSRGNVSCAAQEATVCGTFKTPQDAATFAPVMAAELERMASDVFQHNVCPITYGGYTFQAVSLPGSCVDLSSTFTCGPAPDPFPNCKCNKTRGIAPFYMQPVVTVEQGRSPRLSLFCFTVDRVPEYALVQSSCVTTMLNKVEFWAEDSNRRNITGIRVTPKGGNPKWLSATWGSLGDDTLKATPLNWKMSDAIGGQVCIEVRNGTQLLDICKGGACFTSLFNDNRRCCPTFGSALASNGTSVL